MTDETEVESSPVREGSRIAKVMARAGICSRREAEAWIAAGRVSVNGRVLDSPAFNVSEADDVRVDGKPLVEPERTRLFLFHKPRGLVTTARDPEGRPTVFDALPAELPRLVAIGRLDINTEGLLLLTNDGGLARVLELPSTGWLRRYRVRVHGRVDQAALDRLSGGITIDGINYLGIEATFDREQGSNAWITMGLREGKNREIKRVLEHLGLDVNRLIRLSFGPFELGDLTEGEVAEVRTRVLRDQLGAKLAREAGADFDAPVIDRAAPKPEPSQAERSAGRRPRENDGAKRAGGDRRATARQGRPERDEAPRRPPPPSTPERRRKHVSTLRAEIAADAAGPRKRVERTATHDRKGRTIAVERISMAGDRGLERPADERRGKGGGRAKPRPFAASDRPRRPDSFETKRGRDGEGRERRFDRPEAGRGGDRPNRAPRTRDAPREGRERKFGPPRGETRDRSSEVRAARSGGTERGPRSEFKPRGPRPEARDDEGRERRGGDRPNRAPRSGAAAGPTRERKFDRPRSERRDGASEARPARSGAQDRGPRSEFKPRGPRPETRGGARPERRFDRAGDKRGGEGRSTPRSGAPGGGSSRGPQSGPRRPPRKP